MTFRVDAERVISAARQLLTLAELSDPPVPIDRLAELQGVREIIYEPIDDADAELVPTTRGYVIRVDSGAPESRQRFSIAHEIAHTFYPQGGTAHRNRNVSARRSSQAGWGYVKEEKLCDMAAAELLMPRELFFRELTGREPSVALITHLSNRFGTSIQSTAVRYTELCSPRAQIVRWTKRKKGLRAETVRGEPVVEIQSMSFVDADSYIGSNVNAAYSSRTTVRAFDIDPDSSPPERIWIESRGFGRNDQRYVLTILRSARIG